ncbi:MAG: lycopene cyclase domain-containing protein [Nanoarchaeota archaeon]
MEYLLILLVFLVISIFLERKYNIHLYHSKKERFTTPIIIFLIGTIIDYYATWKGYWIFPGNGLIGIRIFGLPIEEFLFFLIMPYFAFTVYRIFHNKVKYFNHLK